MKTEADLYGRLVELCDRLVVATTAGGAEWRDDKDDRFVLHRDAGTVAISSRDKDGEPPYELAIYNANGDKVETLTSEWLEDDQPARWNQALADVYRAGRRSALGADRIIDALMEELPPVYEEPAAAEEEPAGTIAVT
jgi:hypothetical protein